MMGVFKLNEEGHYDITPIEVSEEGKTQVKALIDEWKAWKDRMLGPQKGTLAICIIELEMLFGFRSFKDLRR